MLIKPLFLKNSDDAFAATWISSISPEFARTWGAFSS
jgi:hypothetical protein